MGPDVRYVATIAPYTSGLSMLKLASILWYPSLHMQ
jgi:hypothetical protein